MTGRAKPQDVDDPPPAVSHRLEVFSVELYLDDVMSRIPSSTVDLATDDGRAKFRAWLKGQIEYVLLQLRWAVQKGAERGIDQAISLAQDPAYYETRKRRRRSERERNRFYQERMRAESEQWRQEEAERKRKAEEETRELIQAGKLVPIPSHRWKLHEMPGGKTDPPSDTAG